MTDTHTLFPARLRGPAPWGTIEPVRAYLDVHDIDHRSPTSLVVLSTRPGGPQVATVKRRTIHAVLAAEVDAWSIDRQVWRIDVDGVEFVVEGGAGCGCGHPLKRFMLDRDERVALVRNQPTAVLAD